MERILVDIDGVLGDVYSHFIAKEYAETGIMLNPDSLRGILEENAFPHFDKHVNQVDFFRTVPPMPGSRDGLKYLNDKYNVLLVSSSIEFPNSLKAKIEWIAEYYPFITWKQLVFCGRKDIVKGDIMIDDHPKNLDFFEGRRIIFTQPHNYYVSNDSYTRVNSWAQIMNLL